MSSELLSGPLSGLKVIDFGWYYAGSMAGMMLADQGATVIRIIKPGEREIQDQQFRLLNRNKKLLELDLKTEDGKAQALSLIGQADVLIENFRPGVMKRLGLDYASVKQLNPGLVYLSLPGFASTDKERSHIQAWEGVLGAACGLYTDTHWMRQALGYPPLYSWVPHASAYGAIHGMIAVMAALHARTVYGCGTVIETPLVDAGLAGFTINALKIDKSPKQEASVPLSLQPYAYDPIDSEEVQLQKLSKAVWTGITPTGRPYNCADGRQLFVWNVDGPFAVATYRLLGLEKQIREEGFIDAGLWDKYGSDNNIGASYLLKPEHKERLTQLLADVFVTKSAREWEEIFAKAGLLAVAVVSRNEYLASEAMHKTDVLCRMGEADRQLTVPGLIVDISGSDGHVKSSLYEAKTITAKQALSLMGEKAKGTPRENLSLNKGDLLSDLKVLDLSNVVAGPVGGWTLAEYGADVIVAAPPTYLHPLVLPQTIAVNQGKRSILLDISTAEGRQLLHELVAWADVVLHNSLDETARRLGVTHQQLQAIQPDIISCQLSALGGPVKGGWEHRRGFDPVVCMATGMMAHYGTLEQPQPHGSTSCGDVMGGLCAAFAILVALYQKQQTGFASEAKTSLVRANNFIQLPYMIANACGSSDWGEPHGQFAKGESWHHRLYQCSDGWIYVGAREDQGNLLKKAVTESSNISEKELEVAFVQEVCSVWLMKLDAANISCHRVMSISDVGMKSCNVDNEAADETGRGHYGTLCWVDHPSGKSVTLMNPKHVMIGEGHSYRRLAPAPRFGQYTREILAELGYSQDEIEEFINLKVSYEHLPQLGQDDYLFEPWKKQ